MKVRVLAYHLDLDSGDAGLVTFPYLVISKQFICKITFGSDLHLHENQKEKEKVNIGIAHCELQDI